MQTCIGCHGNIHQTFQHTGMGESWSIATPDKSSANFSKHAYVFDSVKNFWYHPYWKNDSMFINEFRLSGTDTVYQRRENISWIVGSGQHTNSHIWQVNGFLFQAPLTFYSQNGIWDLPPGFEEGMSSRWNRIISIECMNCHSMYPEFDEQSENKFISVKSGIECERCHGPGEIHVREKMEGILVDTSSEIDYSIVNPKKLPRDLQVELCQRCHLQGISVLNEGKTFFDFKPGMHLNEVMNVFMPRYQGNPDKFIMASHADRMKQSQCYLNSEMTCLTCHNPHVSVKEISKDVFNQKCQSCHGENKGCALSLPERQKENDNCFGCHMPVSETIDIPHVTVHDHRIHIPVTEKKKEEIIQFIGLECMTNSNPSPLIIAQGYLQAYEAFSPQAFLLDSAFRYLNLKSEDSRVYNEELIRYYYLKQDFASALKQTIRSDYTAWTCYRIGECYFQTGNNLQAKKYFASACSLLPKNPEFLNKYGSALMALQEVDSAKEVFHMIVDLNPKFAAALSNLGYIYFLKADFIYAEKLFDQALSLDPDYEQALLNKAALKVFQGRKEEAGKLLQRVLDINPNSEKARVALKQLNS